MPSPPAATIQWKLRHTTLDLTWNAAIMGILNVTPDSFSDGGKFIDPEIAADHAMAMVRDGAQIIDIGGESTRPGADNVPLAVELNRVIPVIRAIRARTDILLSIDTTKSAVARAAIEAGVDVINDISAFTADPDMAGLAAESGVGVVLMHMRGTPKTMQNDTQYDDVVDHVQDFLRQRFDAAVSCGIDPMCIALDPGIGFGKSPDHNRALILSTARFAALARPVLLGVSRKSFLKWAADATDTADRLWAGVAVTCLGRELGARLFRVHDVREHREALRMTEAILNGVKPV